MNSVSIEVAQKEVNAWMDAKQISVRKREKFQDSIENLVEGFQDGVLVLNEETNEITQKLNFNAGETSELVFKPRIDVGSLHSYLKNTKPGDSDGRVLAYICALTNKPAATIAKMDSEDYNVSANIAVFFF